MANNVLNSTNFLEEITLKLVIPMIDKILLDAFDLEQNLGTFRGTRKILNFPDSVGVPYLRWATAARTYLPKPPIDYQL